MEAKTRTRRHLSAQAWREVFGRFDASGESVTGFCKREGLHTSSFRRWRQRLPYQAAVQPTTPALQPGTSSPAAPAAGFIDVGSLAAAAASPAAARLEIRVDLGGGVVLQLVRG